MLARPNGGTYRVFHCVSHVFLYCLHSDRFFNSLLRLVISLIQVISRKDPPRHHRGRHLEIADHQISSQPKSDMWTHLIMSFLSHSLPDLRLVSSISIFKPLPSSFKCTSEFRIILSSAPTRHEGTYPTDFRHNMTVS
jgi:hypothetical protein